MAFPSDGVVAIPLETGSWGTSSRPSCRSGVGAGCLRGRDHVFDSRSDLWPFAGFQTAIRIDPQLISRESLRGRLQERGHFINSWDPRRMDVIHARADLRRITVPGKSIEQFHL